MNKPLSKFTQIPALILAGGLGTRLRQVVSDCPKPLAQINNRPFLSYLLDQLHHAGVNDVVFCTGYLGDQLNQTFGDDYKGMRLYYSRESQPLGTGGALRLGLSMTDANTVMALNGDSYVDADLKALLDFHRAGAAQVSMLLTQVSDTSRYGRVRLGQTGNVESFEEKGAHEGPGLINAGIYLMPRVVLEQFPVNEPFSLERDVLPKLTGTTLRGLVHNGRFIDIGTPESYRTAAAFFSDIEALQALDKKP